MRHSPAAAVLLVWLFALSATAATITVPDDHPVIQDAINAAADGDTVLVRAGTWSGDGNRDLDLLGKAITLTSEEGPELTIIECNGTMDQSRRGIRFHNGEGPDTVVSGFTITGGFAYEGGGILCEDGAPTLTGNIITGNDAEFRGGGITLLYNCDAVVDENLFTNNRVVSSSGWGNSGGGGLSAEFCSPTITNNRFIGNSSGSRGGGLHGLDLRDPVLHNNLVVHNMAAQDGGGWSISADTAVTISQCTFFGNSATQDGHGLSYHYSSVPLLVENCIFWGNGDTQMYTGTDTAITYTTLQGGEAGIEGYGTITWGPAACDEDPLFVNGPLGGFFLSQTAAGQPEDSFCLDRGNPSGPLPAGTTRTDLVADTLWPDMGYHYTVPVKDLLQVDPAGIVFTVEAGAGNPPPQMLSIWNGGPNSMDWFVSDDADWLTLDPISGDSPTGEIDPVTVTVDATNLGHGTYSASILVEAPGSLGAPLAVPVELRVTESFTVDASGGGDFTTIRDGLDAALPGDTLLLAPGTYTGAQNRDLLIDTGDITVSSTHGPDKTVIDCQLLGRGFTIDVDDPDRPVTLSGITVANGQAESGGGVHCSGESSLTLDDVQIHTSHATVDGGGLLCTGLAMVVTGNTSIDGNTAADLGGGICVRQFASLQLEDSTVAHNLCESRGGGLAGFDSATLIVSRSTIENNEAPYWGGGIFNRGDDRFLVENSTLRGNRAGFSGGAIYGFSYVEALIQGNLIEGNQASWGGGICTHGRVVNNLIIGNVATNSGGGLTTEGISAPRVESCTFFNNSAVNRGGAIDCWDSSYAHLRNCILWNNHAPYGREVYADEDSTIYIDFCDVDTTGDWSGGIGQTEWGEGNLESAPLFAQGPLGWFCLSQQAAGQPVTSPCVDAGDPLSDPIDGSTRTDGLQDTGTLDIGYHYPVTSGAFVCSQPEQLAFGTTPGVPPPEQLLYIWRCGTGTLEWAVSADQPWILLSPPSGSSAGEVDQATVGIDPAGLNKGEYQATITIANPGGSAPPVTVPVTLTVGEPLIAFSPESFSYSVMVKENPPPSNILEIWQGGNGVLHWSVSDDASWLTLSPLSGSSTGEIDLVDVEVDQTGLPYGTYETEITIESPNALNSPQQVPVHLRVDEFIIDIFPLSFGFSAQAGGPPPPDEPLRIRNNGSGTMAWDMSCEAGWVHFDIASGEVSDGVSTVLVGVDTTLMEPGQYQADLILSAEGASNTPVTIPVYLAVEFDGLVTGPGPAEANPPLVRIFPPVDGVQPLLEFSAYGATQFGVNVSVGELDKDGFDEILTGAGPGEIYGPHVRGFEFDGTPLPGLSFLAYGTNKFGASVTAGDLDRDGYDEIVTGAGPGEVFGPHVRGWNYDDGPGVIPMPGISFMAYGTPKWGVNVAVGDIDGDNVGEIVTGPGPGAVYGPHVRGWNVYAGTASAMPDVSFMAYGTNKFGVNVTAGDVDGDGIDEILTGAGPGLVFGPHVRGWNYDGVFIRPLQGYSFFAWQNAPLTHGVNVFAGTDLDGDGRDELVAGRGPAPDADTEVKVFAYDGTTVSQWISLEAYPGLNQGTNVAAGRF